MSGAAVNLLGNSLDEPVSAPSAAFGFHVVCLTVIILLNFRPPSGFR